MAAAAFLLMFVLAKPYVTYFILLAQYFESKIKTRICYIDELGLMSTELLWRIHKGFTGFLK